MQVTSFTPKDGINAKSHRKEDHFLYGYKLIVPSSQPSERWFADTKIDLRIYGTQAMNYACVWIFGPDIHATGSGKAGGYGYHRASAATQEALNSAGVVLDQSISGVGDGAMEDALIAIAKHMGYTQYQIIKCHP
jgi:hypothetical protein